MYKDTYDYQLPPDLKQKGCYFEDPTRIFNSICVINRTLDPFCVVQVCLFSLLHSQNNVSDCTIISSMISCALYESRFKKPLISGILYPQANSQPAVNRFGKYYIRLFFNGIPRRVEVDHRILIKPNHRPVGTFSKVDGELWPSLIEKAFLKAHGGFGYHGGNGCQDTYILTGWIPENINLRDETEGNINQIWTRLYRAFRCVFHPSVECRAGDCVITSGTTADITEDDEKRLGLGSSHCYCVCRVGEEERCDVVGGSRRPAIDSVAESVGIRVMERKVLLSGSTELDAGDTSRNEKRIRCRNCVLTICNVQIIRVLTTVCSGWSSATS